MEKNPYTMAKLGLDSKDNLKPKRDCGFYAKYIFLFLSLIQFLIILGLVLFMVYGNPQESTKRRIEALEDNVAQCQRKEDDLKNGVAALKRQVNASQVEIRRAQKEATWINNTLRSCNAEKAKLIELRKKDLESLKMVYECTYNLQLLNLTCPANLEILQEKLKTQEARARVNEDRLSREIQDLQGSVKAAEKEKKDCHLEKLQLQAHSQTYRQLKSQILASVEPAQQKLRSTMDQAASQLPYLSCHDASTTCRGISSDLQSHFELLSRQVDHKVNDAAQKNAELVLEKATCGHSLQESERQLAFQQQQWEREKRVLQEAQDAEIKKMYAERQQLLGQKEALQTSLEQSKQLCIRTKINTAPPSNPGFRSPLFPPANFPGPFMNTGSLGNPLGAAAIPNTNANHGRSGPLAQPSSNSQGSLSSAEQSKALKAAMDRAKQVNPPSVPKPEVQASG
ncbi:plasmalemma vesicle-associated protein [Elgaria multicarinata webbii]|uniref:plasmalemma vesicle-associated protein n=1 Tax=Elgaria multicarinata webbii TaxID=159646 RepID=UPI002FCD4525